jgi:hypothetical protein
LGARKPGACGQRYADHRGFAEQQIDADQQAERPGRGRPAKMMSGKDEIDDAARQDPTLAAGELGVPRGAPRQRGR